MKAKKKPERAKNREIATNDLLIYTATHRNIYVGITDKHNHCI